ncbi:MAG: O-methyltransferase [Hyphomicrobiales bacterium]
MEPNAWSHVDEYFAGLFAPADPALEAGLTDAKKAGLPEIQVSPLLGKLLHVLARAVDARAILEIGTLGGYSTTWLARALADGGRLVTLEYEAKHAEVARRNLARAGLTERVEIRVGKALESLPQVERDGFGPFDLVFIDADKPSNPDYFRWALKLTRKGGLILIDNVVRSGKVAEAKNDDPDVVGTRRVLEMMAAEPRVAATALQVVGVKGHDGIAIATVVS